MADASDEALRRLPHQPPFRMIDRALLVEPGAHAVAAKQISQADPHVDGNGAWPPVLLAEMMAETAGLAAAGADGQLAVVAKLARLRCRRVFVGDRLVCVARVVRLFGGSAMVRAVVRTDRRRCAAGELVLRFS